jgi:uncharacterized membrane protein YdjX (TVP38/TMEM64 family)
MVKDDGEEEEDPEDRSSQACSRSIAETVAEECTLGRVVLVAFLLVLIIVPPIIVFGVVGTRRVARLFIRAAPKEPTIWNAVGFFLVNTTIIVTALPLWVLACMCVGFVFGFWIGFAINFVTIITGSMICFFIGRYVATDTIRTWLMKRRETGLVTRIIEQNDFKFLVLFRFMPLPLCVKNYVPSTIRVNPFMFMLSVMIASGMYTPIYTFVGATTKGIATLIAEQKENPEESPRGIFHVNGVQITIVAIALMSSIAITVLGYIEWKKITKENEDFLLNPANPANPARNSGRDPERP